jgi:hypothetical protein
LSIILLYTNQHHHGEVVWQYSSMGLMNGLTPPPTTSQRTSWAFLAGKTISSFLSHHGQQNIARIKIVP